MEESVMDGKIVLGMNPYKEVCTLHLAGKMLIDKTVVLRLTNSAFENAKIAVELIKNAIFKDEQIRKSGGELGLVHSMKRLESILNNERNPQEIEFEESMEEEDEKPKVEDKPIESKISDKGNGVIEMNASEDECVAVEEVSAGDKQKKKVIEVNLDGSDSEEESVQTLTGKDVHGGGRQWYKQSWKK